MSKPIRLRARVKRKAPSLPMYIEVPASAVKTWGLSGTTPIEVSLNGVDVGRRNLKFWGQGRDCWFLELTQRICGQAGILNNSQVSAVLNLATTQLPGELSSLIERQTKARRKWGALTASQKRMLADHVREAKQSSTRTRRAKKALSVT